MLEVTQIFCSETPKLFSGTNRLGKASILTAAPLLKRGCLGTTLIAAHEIIYLRQWNKLF
jgi:hypothetical protein